MSVSITHEETLISVAATLVALSSTKPDDCPSPLLQWAAKKAVSEMIPNTTDIPLDVQAAHIFNIFVQENQKALKARYPDDFGEPGFTNEIINLSSIDISSNALPVHSKNDKNMDGYTALWAHLYSLSHGHHEWIGEHSLSSNLSNLSGAAIKSMVEMVKPKDSISVADLAESLTRLAAGGDYLFVEQNALLSRVKQLQIISPNQDEFDGSNTLLTLYTHAMYKEAITLPFGEQKWEMESVRMHRKGDYRVSGDIPYPMQADADLVNAAISVIETSLREKPLLDTDGHPLSLEEKNKTLSVVRKFAKHYQEASQSLRLQPHVETAHLPFTEAMKLIEEANRPSIEYLIVSTDDIPLPLTQVSGHPEIPERVRQLDYITGDRGAVLKNGSVDLKAILSKMPDVKSRPFFVSPNDDVMLRKGYEVRVESAAVFILRSTTLNVYASLGLPDFDSNLSKEQVAQQLNKAYSEILPGFGDESLKAISSSLEMFSLGQNPSYVLSNIVRALPDPIKEMISTPGAVQLLPKNEPAPEIQAMETQQPVNSPKMSRS